MEVLLSLEVVKVLDGDRKTCELWIREKKKLRGDSKNTGCFGGYFFFSKYDQQNIGFRDGHQRTIERVDVLSGFLSHKAIDQNAKHCDGSRSRSKVKYHAFQTLWKGHHSCIRRGDVKTERKLFWSGKIFEMRLLFLMERTEFPCRYTALPFSTL